MRTSALEKHLSNLVLVLTALPLATALLVARETSQPQSSIGGRADLPAYVHVHDSDNAMERAVHHSASFVALVIAATFGLSS